MVKAIYKKRPRGTSDSFPGHFYDLSEPCPAKLVLILVVLNFCKLHSTNFEGMELIRPMYLIREADIIHWKDYNKLQFIQCACRFTEGCASCGGTGKGSKRAEIKQLIRDLTKVSPYIEKNIFRSVENVNLDTVIAYKQHGEKHSFLDTYENNKQVAGDE